MDGVGVFSFARYAPSWTGEEGDAAGADGAARMLRRCAKVLVHETGHIFGMRHCIHWHCRMNGGAQPAGAPRPNATHRRRTARPLASCRRLVPVILWTVLASDVVCALSGHNGPEECDASPMHLCPLCLRKLQSSAEFDVFVRYERLAAWYARVPPRFCCAGCPVPRTHCGGGIVAPCRMRAQCGLCALPPRLHARPPLPCRPPHTFPPAFARRGLPPSTLQVQ